MNMREILQLAEVRRLARTGEARRVRQAAGLTETEVAAVVGVSMPTISRWESGQRRPRGGAPALAYAELLAELARREASDASSS
jgi:transcriptional regulator with XRE-family HTH domain